VAFDPVLKRRVALKLPRPESLLKPNARSRFLRESRAAAQFNHPNLVQVFEAGEAGLACYIVSAFCEGPNLAEFLRDSAAPAAIAETAELVASVADAVEHIHRLGVLHRDIKPSNILLDPLPQSEAEPRSPASLRSYIPKLTDFGLAKFMDAEAGHTLSGTLIGTVGYMSPEQARCDLKQIGPETDVYALGAVLYEMLTGNQPYRSSSDAVSLQGLLSQAEPTAPRQLRPELPRDLEAICQKCLEKQPDNR
jgi:serine/threonine protein kinase